MRRIRSGVGVEVGHSEKARQIASWRGSKRRQRCSGIERPFGMADSPRRHVVGEQCSPSAPVCVRAQIEVLNVRHGGKGGLQIDRGDAAPAQFAHGEIVLVSGR